jgi:hypothetical protein
MLDIEVETEAVAKLLDSMTDKIKTFGHEEMPQGLTDWQVEDMHRKYPETKAEQVSEEEYSATTMIYPRSRTYEQTHPHRAHAVARRKPVLSAMPRLIKSVLRHPILRPELFDKLLSRMTAMLSEKIKWR